MMRTTSLAPVPARGAEGRAVSEVKDEALRMVERYAHLSPDYQADAVERLANFPTLFTARAGGRLKGVAQVSYSTGGSR